ncbi:MAG: hypothetical protein GC161_07660 [Planctomycetaceae bacterium]|nr:hypothetical protein [Planctomycetaceae bacterium]
MCATDSDRRGPRRNLALPLLLALALVACDRGPKPPAATPPEVLAARDRAAALFAEEYVTEAEAVLLPLLDRRPVDPDDLVAVAICRLAGNLGGQDVEPLVELLERARELAPDDPRVHFNLGRLRYGWGTDWELALRDLRRARELAPGDVPTRIFLAQLLINLAREDGDASRLDDAAALLAEVREAGLEGAGSWYLTALYVSWELALDRDRRDEAAAYLAEFRELEARGIPKPTPTDIQRGNLGRLVPPEPESNAAPVLSPPTLGAPIALAGADLVGDWQRLVLGTERATWRGLTAKDLGVPPPPGRSAETYFVAGEVGPAGVLASDGARAILVEPPDDRENGAWSAREILAAPHGAVLGADLDGDWEDRTAREPGVSQAEWLHVPTSGAIVSVDGSFRLGYEPPGGVRDWLAVDLDHEGDLDLLLLDGAGQFHYLRSDGAEVTGAGAERRSEYRFEPVPLGAPAGPYEWVVAEDFDDDGDTDILLGGPDRMVWLDSLRRDRFRDQSERLPKGVDGAARPLVGDFDGDGFPDLWMPASGQLLRSRFGGGFALEAEQSGAPRPPRNAPVELADVDLDGSADAVWIDGRGDLVGLLALGQTHQRALAPLPLAARPGPLLVADVDGDLSLEVVHVDRAGRLAARRLHGQGGRGLRLALRGIKDTSRGVGAKVEVRAGAHYQKLRWYGEPVLIGLGQNAAADVVRVTWPNGVVQTLLDARAGETRVLEQTEGLIGSCPFLYTFDGERFVFVTDVLGITPLGLPMAPGMLVPPDSDEYVLVRGEQLRPKDGELVMQFTEELREVTYLDQARLLAIDHPIGTEVFPNERFTFPPFPVHEVHQVEAPLAPLAAVDQAGRDWATELAAEDNRFAVPFEAQRGQFMGLATPHSLELSFDPASVADAERLRLVMCGWFYWTDASVNMAAARHPDVEFVPPMLEVPDGKGGWRAAGPPIGFPAGKLKTMVLDVTDLLVKEDPRLRLTSTLRLYWDAIRLDTTPGAGERRETALEPKRAQLWERGFSQTVWLHEEERLEWFDWEQLAEEPRWNQHPGLYTRFGDVLELVGATDNRFAILGAGDALELAFDARELPPVPDGWRRDYLVYFSGWAKDRDPNTEEALFVEPLPFHGMSGYPYGADEKYPETPELDDYRRVWNTRGAKQWIESIAPHAGRAKSNP